MIKVTCELDLRDFHACSGGKDRLDKIKEKGLLDHFQELAEDLWPDGVDEGTLNDWLLFDVDDELERLEDDEDDEDDE